MPQLVIVEGPDMGRSYELTGCLRIGRDAQNDVILERLAARQATVTRYEDAVVFRNLDEQMQARVNGELAHSARLNHGDMIDLEGVVLLFSEDAAPPEPEEPKSHILTRQELFRDATEVVDRLGVNTSDEANRRLLALYRIASLMASATTLDDMARQLLEVVSSELQADRAYLLLIEEDQQTLAESWGYSGGELVDAEVSSSLLDEVITAREAVLTSPGDDIDPSESVIALAIASTMLVPMLHQDRLQGVLGVDLRIGGPREHRFDARELELLTRIAVQAGTGVATMRRLEEPAQFSTNLRSLGRATQWLSSYLDRDGIVKETVTFACSIFQCRRASLLLVDPDTDALRVAYAFGLNRKCWPDIALGRGEGVAGMVLANGRPLLVPDPHTGDAPADVPLQPDRYQTDSFLLAPIRGGEGPLATAEQVAGANSGTPEPAEVVGVLCVTDKLDGRRFSRNDLQLLTILGNQAGIALTNASLYEKATVDNLTRVFVRRHFFQRLSELVRKSRSHERPLSLLMFDLDRFKRLNDTFGHQAGDAVLRETGSRLKSVVRHSDVPCRYGGEEFAVILPDTALDVAATVGERIRASIAGTPVPYAGEAHTVTVSIGIAELTDGEGREALIERADAALYRAKDNGRDRVEVDRDPA